MKRLIVLFMACALTTSCLAQEDRPTSTNTPSRTSPSAGALIMQECTKAVMAGETIVKMHHFAQIDACAAQVRAALLAR